MTSLIRTSRYDPEIAARVCELVADGVSLRKACASLGVSPARIAEWQVKDEVFAERYARAKQLALALMADSLTSLADEARGQNSSEVAAVKLGVETRRWLLSKLLSHTYGDKLDLTSNGERLPTPSHQVDARVQSIVMMAAERMRLAQSLDDEAKSLLD